MNTVQKYVVSNTLTDGDLTWKPTTIIRSDDLVARVGELRQQPGGDLNVMGSATVVSALLGADLVDELNLMIEPVVLGGGKGIFPRDGHMRPFQLTSVQTAATGVQVCRYEPVR